MVQQPDRCKDYGTLMAVGGISSSSLSIFSISQSRYDGVPGTYVDIVRDVINIVSVHWAADRLVSCIYAKERIEIIRS